MFVSYCIGIESGTADIILQAAGKYTYIYCTRDDASFAVRLPPCLRTYEICKTADTVVTNWMSNKNSRKVKLHSNRNNERLCQLIELQKKQRFAVLSSPFLIRVAFAMSLRLCVLLVLLLAIGGVYGIQVFDKQNRFPQEISERLDEYWNLYKTRYNKSYSGNLETSRRIAWEENLITIYKHNMMAAAGHHSYTLRDNHIADLGTRQYIREMVKLIPSRKRRVSNEPIVGAVLHDPRRIPSQLDWRELGFKTPPENQRDCGSCYAYSVATSIQGQIFKKTGMLIPLSEQQLIDCSTSTGNLGCSGGSLRNTLRYLEKAKGLMPQSRYSYTAKQGPCRFVEDLSVVNITSWAVLPARDEKTLEAAVATIGPIAASVNASPKTFQLYHTGVYDDEVCSSDMVNHAMVIVGYTPTEWILKNWWGNGWGENGYMRLAKNKNRCGIANYAAYAKV